MSHRHISHATLARPSAAERLAGPLRYLLPVLFLFILVWAAVPSRSATAVVERYSGFQSPTRLALTSDGDIYVSDHRRGVVVVLDSTGKRIGTISGIGAPLGLAFYEPPPPPPPPDTGKKPKKKDPPPPEAPPPVLYVGDEADGSVRLFVDGDEVGVLGQGSGEFMQPNAIATMTDANGALRVYVVDSKANQVKVYDDQEALLFTFGTAGSGDGEFKFPSDIVIDETRARVYVTDFGNTRIAVFDLDGVFLTSLSAPPNDQGDPVFLRPAGIGIDPDGNLYVVDNGLSCVAILDEQGALIDVIGYRNGQYWTEDLNLPVDVVADGEKIFVTSNRQRQVVVFEVLP